MSYWTHITGTITVEPFGRTQAEKRYIVETVLNHLPVVSGSEEDMYVDIIQKKAGSWSSGSTDEFGEWTKNKWKTKDPFKTDDEYLLVVSGSLRDRMFNETLREFVNWLCRLSKRLGVWDVLVKIESDDRENPYIISCTGFDNVYYKMFEMPSWSRDHDDDSSNWCEYLMWDSVDGSFYPKKLYEKYNGKIE